jgi:hypothetical protein
MPDGGFPEKERCSQSGRPAASGRRTGTRNSCARWRPTSLVRSPGLSRLDRVPHISHLGAGKWPRKNVMPDQPSRALAPCEEFRLAEGRPLVDSITASRIANMKELRPPSSGRSEIRVLLVFDPWRAAILLVAGDKSGQWDKWYRIAIPRAEKPYDDYLAERRKEMGP